jgi:hypothetical protein
MITATVYNSDHPHYWYIDFGANERIAACMTLRNDIGTIEIFVYKSEAYDIQFEIGKHMAWQQATGITSIGFSRIPEYTDNTVEVFLQDKKYTLLVRTEEKCQTTEFDVAYKRRLVLNGFTVGHILKKYPNSSC